MIAAACGAIVFAAAAGCSSHAGCKTCREPTGSAVRRVPAPTAVGAAGPATVGLFGGQKRCPVTGEELGSMGEPLAVTVGGRAVYVCCRGCAKRAQADPAKALAAVAAETAAE